MAAATKLEDSQIVIQRPDAKVVEFQESRVEPQVARAEALVIVDDASYQAAAAFLVDCKTLQKEIRKILDEPVAAAHKAHKAMTNFRNEQIAPLEEAERLTKAKMGAFAEAEQKRADEERRREEEEARKAQEEENLRRAAELEAEGRSQEADQAVAAPIATPVRKAAAPPRAAGTSTRKKYSAEVVDLDALVRAVAEGKAPRGLVIANEKVLNSMATSLKGDFEVPGVQLKTETIVSASGR